MKGAPESSDGQHMLCERGTKDASTPKDSICRKNEIDFVLIPKPVITLYLIFNVYYVMNHDKLWYRKN